MTRNRALRIHLFPVRILCENLKKEDFLRTNELLSMVEFEGNEKIDIWRVIASILHAGNFEFTSTKSGAASVVDREPFEAFSYLLGL